MVLSPFWLGRRRWGYRRTHQSSDARATGWGGRRDERTAGASATRCLPVVPLERAASNGRLSPLGGGEALRWP